MLRRLAPVIAAAAVALSTFAGPAFARVRPATTPAPTVKPGVTGVFDRQHIANAPYLPVVNGGVVKATWSDLQPVKGGPIVTSNAIEDALAEARRLNAVDPTLHLRLKLRVYAGINAPEWAKQLDGAPFSLHDPQTGALIGTVGRFWTARFKAAYDELETKLAARYDMEPLIGDVVIARCTTNFAEPFLRQAGLASNRAAFLAAGYTVAKDQACQAEQIDTHAQVWTHTNSSLALSPYQAIDANGMHVDEPYTESMMAYCRAVLGARCVLGNNSLSWPVGDGAYAAMYDKLTAMGPPLYYQTETAAKMGDWYATLDWAASHGANLVELNAAYDPDYPRSELALFDARLEANRT